jgi:hypothetical protein
VQDYNAAKQWFPVWAQLGTFGIKKAQKGRIEQFWDDWGRFGKFWAELG